MPSLERPAADTDPHPTDAHTHAWAWVSADPGEETQRCACGAYRTSASASRLAESHEIPPELAIPAGPYVQRSDGWWVPQGDDGEHIVTAGCACCEWLDPDVGH